MSCEFQLPPNLRSRRTPNVTRQYKERECRISLSPYTPPLILSLSPPPLLIARFYLFWVLDFFPFCVCVRGLFSFLRNCHSPMGGVRFPNRTAHFHFFLFCFVFDLFFGLFVSETIVQFSRFGVFLQRRKICLGEEQANESSFYGKNSKKN